MNSFVSDLKYSLRTLTKAPGFTAVAIATLALGIGACTAIFSVVNGVLLQSMPYNQPEQLVILREISKQGNQMNVPEANFWDWEKGAQAFDSMAFYNNGEANIAGGSEPVRAFMSSVSPRFFDVLRVKPALGRLPVPDEQKFGSTPVAVVSHGFWQRVMGGDADLARTQLRSFGYSFTVVGVMPPGFEFPTRAEIWVPYSVFTTPNPSRSAHNWRVIARMKNGVTLDRAASEISQIAKRIQNEHGGAGKDVTAVDATALRLADAFTSGIRPALLLLMGAVGVLLLIACANVTNMLLARATAQEKEFAVRAALGASRARLVQQCVTESLLLAIAGATLGAVLAAWGVDAMLALGAGQIPRSQNVTVNLPVLAFALTLSVVTSVVLGLVPGWRASRTALQSAMNEAARGGSSGGSHARMRNVLVVAQVGLTLVLLVGAGLLARSFGKVMEVDLGYQRENRLGLELRIPRARSEADAKRLVEFARQLEERIQGMPGVLSIGGTNSAPMSFAGGNGRFLIEGREHSGQYWPNYRVATPGYFKTMGIPVLQGRVFDSTDGPNTPQVAVISRDVAEKVFPGENPIGRRINTGNMDGDRNFMTIVGIVGDTRDSGPENAANGAIYVHYLQRGGIATFTWVIRSAKDPTTLIAGVRDVVRELNPELAPRFRTLEELFASGVASRQFNLTLLGIFAGVALALAGLGIYGVLAYSVEQRTREIGIRMALGAQPGQVLKMVISQGSKLVLIGVVLGIAGAIAASRLIATMLFNTSPTDPLTYAAVALFLSLVAVVACMVPARHAARVNPMVALRHD